MSVNIVMGGPQSGKLCADFSKPGLWEMRNHLYMLAQLFLGWRHHRTVLLWPMYAKQLQ